MYICDGLCAFIICLFVHTINSICELICIIEILVSALLFVWLHRQLTVCALLGLFAHTKLTDNPQLLDTQICFSFTINRHMILYFM